MVKATTDQSALEDPTHRFLFACVALFLECDDAFRICERLGQTDFLFGRGLVGIKCGVGVNSTSEWPLGTFSNSSAVADLFLRCIDDSRIELSLPELSGFFDLTAKHLQAMIDGKDLIVGDRVDLLLTSEDQSITNLLEFMRRLTGGKGGEAYNFFSNLMGMAAHNAWPTRPRFRELYICSDEFAVLGRRVNLCYREGYL